MKKGLCITILLTGITLLFAQDAPMEPPYQALKLLGDSTAEECPACVSDMQKRAFKIIDAQFPSGKTIETSPGFTFVRNLECDDGELVLSSYRDRTLIKDDQKKGKIYAPLLVFYFHTPRHHLAGTRPEHLTGESVDSIYGGPGELATLHFTGKLEIIPCNYCDGKTFLYFQRRNRIQVQCRVVELRRFKAQ